MKNLTGLAVVLGTALLTTLLAAPVIGPEPTHAEGEYQNGSGNFSALMLAMAPPSALPVEADGLVFDLELDRQTYKVGQKPILTLTASNKKSEARMEKVTVRVFSQEPTSFLSRSMPMPTTVLTKAHSFELDGEASEKLTIETDHAVEAGKLITITIQVGENYVSAGGFSVPAIALATYPAAPRTQQVAGK